MAPKSEKLFDELFTYIVRDLKLPLKMKEISEVIEKEMKSFVGSKDEYNQKFYESCKKLSSKEQDKYQEKLDFIVSKWEAIKQELKNEALIQDNIYYEVHFDDGDFDIILLPREDEWECDEEYDSKNLEHVKKFANTIKNSFIVKVYKEKI